MNKLLLLALLGFVLIALTGASDENNGNSLAGEEFALESFESDGLADAEPRRLRKKKKAKKNKKKAKKNKKKAKKNKKKGKKQKKKGKKNNKKKAKKGNNKSQSRNESCDLGCVDSGVKVMKTIKDKISNYLRQAMRAERQSKVGTNKGNKKDNFKQALEDIIEAGGGNESMLMCSGNATSDVAKQMQNLTATLTNCSNAIQLACGNETFPTPPDADEVERCKMKMESITNMSDVCTGKYGAEACTCWSDAKFTEYTADIKNCSMKDYASKVTKAKKKCVQAFGKCRKFEDDVGKQIHLCNQDSGKLTAKLGAAKANNDSLTKIKTKSEALANATSGKIIRRIRAIGNCEAYLSSATDLISAITSDPTQSPTEIRTKVTELEGFSGTCTADEVTKLGSVISAVDEGIAAVAAVMEKIQEKIVALTGAPASDDAIEDASNDSLNDATTAAPSASTVGSRYFKKLALKNVLKYVAKYA